jgi:hypothetical protein
VVLVVLPGVLTQEVTELLGLMLMSVVFLAVGVVVLTEPQVVLAEWVAEMVFLQAVLAVRLLAVMQAVAAVVPARVVLVVLAETVLLMVLMLPLILVLVAVVLAVLAVLYLAVTAEVVKLPLNGSGRTDNVFTNTNKNGF